MKGLSQPLKQAPKKVPFVLVESGAHGVRVVAANKVAQDSSIYPGLAFTDARARAPDLLYEEIDRAADAKALDKLADWMVRFSPRVSVYNQDALALEITGVSHLFGGEEVFGADVRGRLEQNGYTPRLAIASTLGAAIALACHGQSRCDQTLICKDGQEKADLADLPVKALRLSDDSAQLLRRFGLTRISQLYGLDRKALARRFASKKGADAVVLRLDQALGRRHEPIKPLVAEPEWAVRLACPEPIAAQAGVEHALETLLPQLCEKLDQHGLGARDFCFHVFGVDGHRAHIAVSSARPVRDVAHIQRLLQEHIDTINPGFGIDLFLLTADRTEALDHSTQPLSAEMAGAFDEEAFLRLADRLSVRLGEQAVLMTAYRQSHVPERSEALAAFDTRLMQAPPDAPVTGPRPLRLFSPPEHVEVVAEVPDGPPVRLIWRRVLRKIVRADGPERIAPEWWKLSEKGVRARDYYRVEDDEGRRYWIFRNGLYDDNRGGPPQWFVHGVFA